MRARFAASAGIGAHALTFVLTFALAGCERAKPPGTRLGTDTAHPAVLAATADGPALIPLQIKLPKPAFLRTPRIGPLGFDVSRVKTDDWKPRPPFMAPVGVKNVALGKPVAASDEEPIIGDPEQVTDGDKEAGDGSYVEFGPGTQHVTIDLEQKYEIFAIVVWHYHGDPRIYHDVVVQVADDADAITGTKTLFNNDHDNSSGLGLGDDHEYFERNKGLLVDAKGVKARYVRVQSDGSTVDELNHYTEVEVYGLPVR